MVTRIWLTFALCGARFAVFALSQGRLENNLKQAERAFMFTDMSQKWLFVLLAENKSLMIDFAREWECPLPTELFFYCFVKTEAGLRGKQRWIGDSKYRAQLRLIDHIVNLDEEINLTSITAKVQHSKTRDFLLVLHCGFLCGQLKNVGLFILLNLEGEKTLNGSDFGALALRNKKLFCAIVVLPFMFVMGGCGGNSGSSNASTTTVADTTQTDKTVSVVLTWLAPTANEDGSRLSDLTGYKVHYGINSRFEENLKEYENSVDAQCASCGCLAEENTTCAYTLTFTAGSKNGEATKYYFAVTAYNNSRNESDFSNEASKSIE